MARGGRGGAGRRSGLEERIGELGEGYGLCAFCNYLTSSLLIAEVQRMDILHFHSSN